MFSPNPLYSTELVIILPHKFIKYKNGKENIINKNVKIILKFNDVFERVMLKKKNNGISINF